MAKFVISAFADEGADSIVDQAKLLNKLHIDYIEPRSVDKRVILELSEDELKEVRRVLDEHNIKVGSLGSPIGKYPIEDDFETHLVDFEKALRACEILGTTNMRMFSFFVKQEELEKYRDKVMIRLKTMCALASARGITLCHENESNIYGQMPKEVLDLLTTVEGLHGIFDPANYVLNGGNIEEGVKNTLTRFQYMHIKDAIFDSKMIVPSGEGEGKIAYAINTINDNVDKKVYLTLEPHLKQFGAYAQIDKRELKGKYVYKNSEESFTAAHTALVKVLRENGYTCNENNEWVK